MRAFLSRILPGIAVACVLGACASGASWDEVARLPSPDGTLDAVLSESRDRTTKAFDYHVHVVPTGAAVTGDAAAFLAAATRSTHAHGANLLWSAPRTLEIRYLKAGPVRIDDSAVQEAGPDLRVLLMPGVYDPQAASGRMLNHRKPTDTLPPLPD